MRSTIFKNNLTRTYIKAVHIVCIFLTVCNIIVRAMYTSYFPYNYIIVYEFEKFACQCVFRPFKKFSLWI
jgi:hypothetical protein